MNDRVARLRQLSLDTKPWLSIERAALLTEFYRQAEADSTPVLRAKAFRYLMERKAVFIGDGELIVGERGPAPKGTPTFPELCCHSVQDFEILNTREKISYDVSDEAVRVQRDDVIPLLGGPQHARPHVSRDDARVEGRLRGGHLHGVYGAALARPHGARRRHLPQRPARPQGRRRRRRWPRSIFLPTRRRTTGSRNCSPCRSASMRPPVLPSVMPRRPRNLPRPKPTRAAKPNCCGLRRFAATCRRTSRAISGRPCRLTGSRISR